MADRTSAVAGIPAADPSVAATPATDHPETDTPVATPGKMSLPTLTAMVVGSMVGAGVFSLPARFGVATGILGSLIA
jgi:arginine:ornithine antiporter / lysine permease